MNFYSFLLCGVSCIWLIIPCTARSDQPPDALTAVTKGINLFNVNLYREIAKDQPGNLICSPLSATMVLSMLAFGASGKTRDALYRSLHLPANERIGEDGFRDLTNDLNNFKKVELAVADKIYLARNFDIKREYIKVIEDAFRTTTERIDFSQPEEASEKINNWAAKQTHDRIKNVVKSDNVENAKMVAVNAVYFKGNWSVKFDPKKTHKQTFFVTRESAVDLDMMYQRSTHVFGEVEGLPAKFLELAYNSTDDNDAISMFIVLPNVESSLSKIENKINLNFRELHKRRKTEVDLYMPKFRIESSLELNSPVGKLELDNIFTSAANFSRLTPEKVYLSLLLQKAFIEVNEEGSEAAAVTAGVVKPQIAHSPPPTFRINSPFIYYIVYIRTNTVLFQGHVTEPKSS